MLLALTLVIAWDRYAPTSITIEPGPYPTIVVEIEGAVATPGVVYLPGGARLADAVSAAGGLLANADLPRLNLAGRVTDGESITIPTQPGSSITMNATPGATPANEAGATGLLNINTATVTELDQLPGIGPAIARRIIDFREFYGPFTSIDQLAEVNGISSADQLAEVNGISSAMVDNLRHLVTIGD